MTELELYRDLVNHFRSGLEGTDYEDILLELPNVKATGRGAKDDDGHAIPWIRYNYKPVDGGQATLGGADALFFTVGVIVHQVFVPPYQGLDIALSIAEVIKSVYNGTESAGGVWFRRARTQDVGIKGGWYQVNVSVNFEYKGVRS